MTKLAGTLSLICAKACRRRVIFFSGRKVATVPTIKRSRGIPNADSSALIGLSAKPVDIDAIWNLRDLISR